MSGFLRLLMIAAMMKATIWPMTVATAAPSVPMSKPMGILNKAHVVPLGSMKMGSRMMLMIAPVPWVIIV